MACTRKNAIQKVLRAISQLIAGVGGLNSGLLFSCWAAESLIIHDPITHHVINQLLQPLHFASLLPSPFYRKL